MDGLGRPCHPPRPLLGLSFESLQLPCQAQQQELQGLGPTKQLRARLSVQAQLQLEKPRIGA